MYSSPIRGRSVENTFTELYILEEQDVTETWKKAVGSDSLDHLDMIQKADTSSWHKINISDVMNEDKDVVVFSGFAGYGKSYTLEYMCGEFGKNNLFTNFTFVFLLRCREMNTIDSDMNSVYDLVKMFYPTILADISIQEFESMTDKILILLDGVDELYQLNNVIFSEEPTPFQGVIRGLFLRLKEHGCLLSGRPEASLKVRDMILKESQPVSSIQTVGFSPDQTFKYMESFFGSTDHVGYLKLLDTFKKFPQVEAMAKIPMLLKIICCLYITVEDIESPRTATELYIHALIFFLNNHLKVVGMDMTDLFRSNYNLNNRLVKIIIDLGKVAYQLILKGSIFIPVNDFNDVNFEEFAKSGMVTLIQIQNKVYAFFPHLSFMEILAACYMKSKNMKLKDTMDLQLTLARCFYCGLNGIVVSGENGRFYNFVQSISQKSKRSPAWMKKIVATSHEDVITSACKSMTEKDGNINFGKINSDAMYFMFMCFEHHMIKANMIKSLKSATFKFSGFSSIELVHSLYMLELIVANGISIDCMVFNNCQNIHTEEMKRLISFISRTTWFSFADSPFNTPTLDEIIRALDNHTDINSIREISFKDCSLNDDMLRMLTPYLPFSESVQLQGNLSITSDGYKPLIEAITSVKSKGHRLRTLCVNGSDKYNIHYLLQHARPQITVNGIAQ